MDTKFLRDKKFWFASFLVTWAAALQLISGHFVEVKHCQYDMQSTYLKILGRERYTSIVPMPQGLQCLDETWNCSNIPRYSECLCSYVVGVNEIQGHAIPMARHIFLATPKMPSLSFARLLRNATFKAHMMWLKRQDSFQEKFGNAKQKVDNANQDADDQSEEKLGELHDAVTFEYHGTDEEHLE